MAKEIILMNISGEDRPGVTNAVTSILGEYKARILDIGQSDIHQNLALGILFLTDENLSGYIMKDVLFKCTELGMQVRFKPVPRPEYQDWVGRQGKDRYIVTVLGKIIEAKQIAMITKEFFEQGLNIDSIKRLSGRPSVRDEVVVRSCVEFSVRGQVKDRNKLNERFVDFSTQEGVDISFQKDNIFRRNRRLICFDMDSTLIKTEVIDELAAYAGVGEQVRQITESAMRGDVDFGESFKQRIALLKGLDVSVMEEIAQKLPIMDGADRLVKVLKKCGYKIAILSGGFTYFGNFLKKKFDMDYVYANELEVIDDKLTGRHVGDIVDGQRKASLMKLIAQVEKIDMEQVIAVGDGANDLPMLNEAGLGIAFHAKPKVKESAKQSISTMGLDGILYFLGFRDVHIDQDFDD